MHTIQYECNVTLRESPSACPWFIALSSYVDHSSLQLTPAPSELPGVVLLPLLDFHRTGAAPSNILTKPPTSVEFPIIDVVYTYRCSDIVGLDV